LSKLIQFYLDESGNTLSDFFVVGGFYIVSDDINNIRGIESKIKANILHIEKAIKEFRKNNEESLEQYIPLDNSKNHREVKWNNLTWKNKLFLSRKIKNNHQNNVSIICNLKKLVSKNNKSINLDAIYNMMTYYLVDRTVRTLGIGCDKEVIIKISVDQRKSIPKIPGLVWTGANVKLEGLENYIKTQIYLNSPFTNVNINVKQFESKSNPLIRYADYYVGLISSMCRFLNNSSNIWDKDINVLFKMVHQKIPCTCHYTIKDQCEIITKVCAECKVWSHFK
jgi:hypothetical protein